MIDEFTPAYSRSWTEIEWMLAEAQEQMYEQKSKFQHRKRVKDKDGCRRAAAKYARAKGMADVLLWVLGGPGVIDPMRGFEDVSESSSLQQFSSQLLPMNKLDTLLGHDFQQDSILCQRI